MEEETSMIHKNDTIQMLSQKMARGNQEGTQMYNKGADMSQNH